MRFLSFSVFSSPLFNHPGLKGHTEFSGDKEACRRGGAATEMSNRLTTYSTTLPSMGNRGGDRSDTVHVGNGGWVCSIKKHSDILSVSLHLQCKFKHKGKKGINTTHNHKGTPKSELV